MARMAVLQTELTPETIHPDELAAISEDGVLSDSGIKLVRRGDWVGFDGRQSFVGGVDFFRSSGLNTKTGKLCIGNIQMEAPLERKLDAPATSKWPKVYPDGAIASRNPIIMELERLARDRIGKITLIDVANDGEFKNMDDYDQKSFETWMAKYDTAVERSKTGLPRIEGFYRENRNGGGTYMMAHQLRILFGERIHSLMRDV